jgi:allantoinase
VIDTVVRGGVIVTPEGRRTADIAIAGGRIVDVGAEVGDARDVIDARGLLVLPGLIDVHVHFNEPGRTEWEGAATGSAALAAGGGTLFVDMPLNSAPCTIDVAAFDAKRAALEAAAITDFALWGGLVPGSIGDMAALAGRGVVGFKAFMSNSGLPEFSRADDATLLEGLAEAARLKLPVSVHAESEEITRELSQRAAGRDARAFLASRPVIAELEAIQRLLLFAAETGAAVHIVHVSSGRGVALAAEARARGVDVSIETCPHYLFFTEEDVERLGAVAKCAPPLRAAGEQAALWDQVASGAVDIIGSDHSPCPPEMKAGEFMAAWGGIAGGQSTLAVLLERGYHAGRLPIEHIVELVSATPARRFRFGSKGEIGVGRDADLLLLDPDEPWTQRAGDLRQRHPISPYVGSSFRGRVRRTLRRGETIVDDGRITAALPPPPTRGRFVRPGG